MNEDQNSAEDVAATIVSCLRATDTTDQGAALLTELHLDRASLLLVAAAAGLTRVDRLSTKALVARVLQQTIGARRKYAGLRKW